MGDQLQLVTAANAFPVLAQQIHGQPLAYLDNAATTQVPLTVLAAMRRFEDHDRANIHRGVHTLSQRATDAFEASRDTLKRFIGADASQELVFTSGTTEALNLVAQGLSAAGHDAAVIRPGDEIIVSGLEHHANLVPWQAAARRSGATLRILLPDAQGRLQVADLKSMLNERTRVFALTACANATGECPPYAALLALAAEAGALTVLDAAQAVSHAVPDLSVLACDYMAFSGHKMYGPMGIGVLAGRRAALERLVPLRLGRVPRHLSLAFRLAPLAHEWGLVDVFMLGVVVSLIKLGNLATVVPGIALWSFGVLIVLLTAVGASFDAREFWLRAATNRAALDRAAGGAGGRALEPAT